MTFSKKIESNFRYERKLAVTDASKPQVQHYIKGHPIFFREIYVPRQVNNIYLDTPQLKFYEDNVMGVAQRKKVRLRWYGDTFGQITAPRLEYKIKAGLLGDKWVFPLPDFELKPGFDQTSIKNLLSAAELPAEILADVQSLRPTLLNNYQRIYYLSADRAFRLTLDDQQSFYHMNACSNQFLSSHSDNKTQIIEIKYAPEADKKARGITNFFPFRLTKSSKYVSGINFVQKGIKV